MSERTAFPHISSRAWEHPADRAALQSLRKVPGFDVLVRKLMGFVSERPLRAITEGSAVHVSAGQYPRIHSIYEEVLVTFDAPRRPDLFVTQNPVINAGAVGMDDPFIVLNSATVTSLDDGQLRGVLGHELGHVLSDHVLYKTMLRMLLKGGALFLRMPLTGLAMLPIVGAMLEWDRKSELSADRASLLACQDPEIVRATLLKMAGGVGEGASVDAFRDQAARYEEDGSAVDNIVRMLALLGRRHPFPVQRLRELDSWVDSGGFQKVLDGDYPRREDDSTESAWQTWKDSAEGYADGFKSTTEPVAQWFKDTGTDVADAAGSALQWLRGDRDSDGSAQGAQDALSPTEDGDHVDWPAEE